MAARPQWRPQWLRPSPLAPSSLSYRQAEPTRFVPSLYHHKASNNFPLIASNNLLSRFHVGRFDFRGQQSYDEDHPVPAAMSDRADVSTFHKWSDWEKKLNPQLYNNHKAVTPTPEYVGVTRGRLNPVLGWIKKGGPRKFWQNERKMRLKWNLAYGLYVEGRRGHPVVKRVPRFGANGPNHRFEGKLVYTDIKLSKIIWAMDAGILNRNEVITMHALLTAGLILEAELVWPGLCLVAGEVKQLKYPIHLELQRAHPEAIRLVEDAGGTFLATYLSPEGIYQELHPEEFPVFLDQNLPDTHSFHNVHALPAERGYLAQWYEDEGKYAHPDSGRRLSHYVSPPHARDFPATFEEYERVKHFQKFHFEQPGTGTELPWMPEGTADHMRPRTGALRH